MNLKKFCFLVLGAITIGTITGCNKDPEYIPVAYSRAEIMEFWLEKTESNPNLNRAYPGMVIGDSAIRMQVDFGTDITALEPTIITLADSISPKGKQNFTNPVKYTLWANGKSLSYKVSISVSPIQSPVVKTIAAGFAHIIAIKTDGTVWACGNNSSGQLGLGDYSNRNRLTQVPVYDVEQVFTGDAATIFKLKDGSAWGTGNQYGQLGLGHKNPISTLTRVPYFDDAKDIAITFGETFILKPDGSLWGAGRNLDKLLAQGDGELRASFVKIPIDDVKQISGEGFDMVVQKTNGEIWCWGKNLAGQLGLGDNQPRATPVRMPSPSTNINRIFTGAATFLMDSAGNVWGSGANVYGQLALGDLSNRNVFTPIPSLSNKSIDVIISRSGASSFLKYDGTIWNVGSNTLGLMGLGNQTTLPYTTPVELPNFTASMIGGNGNAAFALRSDGTLWAWGANSSGTLGIGSDVTVISSPTQIK